MKAQRQSARFLASLPDHLNQEELLELLLRYSEAEPEQTAQALLSHYGDLANVLDTTAEDLQESSDLSTKSLALVRLVAELHRRYLLIRSRPGPCLPGTASIHRYFLNLFQEAKEEAAYLLCMNAARTVLDCSPLCKGSSNSHELSLRSITETALQYNASTIVLAYYRPKGEPVFRSEDAELAATLSHVLEPMEISLLDSFLFTESTFLTLFESDLSL